MAFKIPGPKTVSPASELLRAAANAVGPDNWCRGAMAEAYYGEPLDDAFHRDACRRCALAHLQVWAAELKTSDEERWRSWAAIEMAIWQRTRRTLPAGAVATLVEFNDEIAKTADDVASIFDEGARLLETGAVQ